MTRDPLVYIHHALDAIKEIEVYIDDTPTIEDFIQDNKTHDAVIMQLMIVGEALRNLPKDFLVSHPELDTSGPVGLRNVLVHEYFEVSLKTVWALIEKDLPKLKSDLEKCLA
ncbi:MAG: DUF86 domain-containing protein [Patescibacteria group bacterium]